MILPCIGYSSSVGMSPASAMLGPGPFPSAGGGRSLSSSYDGDLFDLERANSAGDIAIASRSRLGVNGTKEEEGRLVSGTLPLGGGEDGGVLAGLDIATTLKPWIESHHRRKR